MNYDERNQQNRGYRNFRTGLDFGMGIFYIIIGISVFYLRYFGAIELQKGYAYALGLLIIFYGIFRISRGVVGIRDQQRRKNNKQ
jgi:hypothetical protein